MKRIVYILVLFFFCLMNVTAEGQAGRQRLLMDFNWKFIQSDVKDAQVPDFNDSGWRTLNLPHDWSIEGTFSKDAPAGGNGGYLPTGIGWYRKHFDVTKNDLSKIIWIEFDGVYMNSDVWINGHHLGLHPYGYTSFYYNLTPYLKEGENIVAVRVDNSLQPNSRWYTGSGIYRNVWLVKMEPLHFAHWGVYVTTPEVSQESADVKVRTKIDNDYKSSKSGMLSSVIVDAAGKKVSENEISFTVKPGGTIELSQNLKVKSPSLWSVDSPNLYKLYQKIIEGKNTVDDLPTTIGIRKIVYDVNKGFLLNGEHVKMNGVCLHHDGGCVGAAVPVAVWRYRLKKLKEMGCNAIRTSHNPPAPEFLDLCDEMGFLVMDESYDEWKLPKRKYGYHIYFDKYGKQDLTSMLERDRNHPSVVIWSVGNEIPDQKTDEGVKTLKTLVDICHKVDPTRPVTSACDNIAADGGATKLGFLNELDIVGYNYVDRWHKRRELYYSIDRHDHPNWKMIGTESESNNGGIRGEYSLGRDSSGINPNYNFRMIDPEQLWKFVRMHDYVIGDFMWTGIDYLGESFWPFKNWSFGVLDLCGFRKDGYYFYQSQWTKKPMLHLFPNWSPSKNATWNVKDGQIIPVLCYTNCNEVELFLNGKSYGIKQMQFPRQGHSGAWNKYAHPVVNYTTADLHLEWDVPYEPGVLKAVGKIDGKVVCTEELRTAGRPAGIRLIPDRDTINSDGRDVSNVKVEIVDSSGYMVPTADNLVQFSIEGEGKIIGVGNGNPLDHEPFKAMQRKAFNGLCLAVVQSSEKAGEITLTASSKGLKGTSISIKVKHVIPAPAVP